MSSIIFQPSLLLRKPSLIWYGTLLLFFFSERLLLTAQNALVAPSKFNILHFLLEALIWEFFKSFKHVLWNNSYLSTLVHSLNLLIVFLNFRNKFSPINLRHFFPTLCVWFRFLLLERSICSMRTLSLLYCMKSINIYIQKDKKHFCTQTFIETVVIFYTFVPKLSKNRGIVGKTL